jgi:ATP-binding cassette subfamily B protein
VSEAALPEANSERKSEALNRPQLPSLLALRPYVVRHSGMLLGAVIALITSAAAMLTIPVAVRRMIDVGFAAQDGVFIDRYFVTLIGIGILLALASAGRMYAVNWLGERVVADLRADVFRRLATLGPPFYDSTHSSEVMSRLTADTTQIKGAAGSALSQALRNLIMLVGALTMMFITSPTLAALGLATIPIIVLPLMAYGRAVRRLSRAAQDRLAEASAIAAENLAAVRTMHAFGQQETVTRRFAQACERAFEAARTRLLARAGLTAISIGLIVSSVVAILWFASGDRGRDHGRPTWSVHPLCHVRRRSDCRALRGVGRDRASRRRIRAADGALSGATNSERARATPTHASAGTGHD